MKLFPILIFVCLVGCDGPENVAKNKTPATRDTTGGSAAVDPVTILSNARNDESAAKAKAISLLAASSPKYRQLGLEAQRLRVELDAARLTSDTASKLAISKSYNEVRLELERLEKLTIDSNKDVLAAADAVRRAEYLVSENRKQLALQAAIDKKAVAEKEVLRRKQHQNIEILGVGAVGILPPFTITQIVSGHKMLIRADDGTILMLDGIPTANCADEQRKSLDSPVKIVGTETYTTVLGASATVLLARPAP